MTPLRIAVALVTTLALTMTTASAYAAGGHGGGGHGGGGHGGHGGGHGWHGGHSRVSIGFGWGGYGYPYYYPYYPYSYAPYYWPYYNAPYGYAPSAASAPVYVERGGAQAQSGSWYYCQQLNGYYPYVRECPGEWTPVPMQPPAQAPAPPAG